MRGRHIRPSVRWPMREAWRDVTAGVANPVLWFLVTVVILLGCCGSDALAVRGMADQAWAAREAGGDVLVVESTGGVDARACVGLDSLPGVTAAMALRGTDMVRPLALPEAPYSAVEVVGDMSAMLDIRGGSGFDIPDQVGRQLGIGVGDAFRLDDGSGETVSGVFAWPKDGRLPQYASTVMVEAPKTELDAAFDACWVRSWPLTQATRDALIATVDKVDQSQGAAAMPAVSSLNPTVGAAVPAAADYRGRMTRLLAVAAFSLCFAVGAAFVIQRRIPLALLRHFGATRPQVALQMMLEACAFAVPAVGVALGVCSLALAPAASGVVDAVGLMVDIALRGCAAGMSGLLLGVCAASLTISAAALPTLVRGR